MGRYGTYKQAQKLPGGDKLVGFTRILHRTVPDLLMDEASLWNLLLLHDDVQKIGESVIGYVDRPANVCHAGAHIQGRPSHTIL